MTGDQVERRILAKDASIVREITTFGEVAFPPLLKLIKNDDTYVRKLALTCLEQLGGEQAVKAFVEALNDPALENRALAIDALQKHYNPSIMPSLMEYLQNHPDLYVRTLIPLVMGRIGDVSTIPWLKERLKEEKNPDVANNIRLSLARLGDSDSKEEVMTQLESRSKEVRFSALKKIEYIHDKALVKRLAPLLEDNAEVLNIGKSPYSKFLRMCDFTLYVIASQYDDNPFSFAVVYRNYTKEEIEEVSRFLNSLP